MTIYFFILTSEILNPFQSQLGTRTANNNTSLLAGYLFRSSSGMHQMLMTKLWPFPPPLLKAQHFCQQSSAKVLKNMRHRTMPELLKQLPHYQAGWFSSSFMQPQSCQVPVILKTRHDLGIGTGWAPWCHHPCLWNLQAGGLSSDTLDFPYRKVVAFFK